MSNSKGWLELGLMQYFNKRTMHLQESDETKGKGCRVLSAVTCGW